jgi:prepilin-type N-terminal cleavage/methylation domain-containing protein
MKKRLTWGFTLIELLVVIGILGIMFALSASLLTGWREYNQLLEAQRQVAQDMERVRTYVRRYSTNYEVTFNPGSYSARPVIYSSAGLVIDAPGLLPKIDRTSIPNQVTLVPGTNSTKFTFRGPYGRSPGGADAICIGLKLNNSMTQPQTEVTLVGVTGKVITRGKVADPLCPSPPPAAN